MHGADRNAITAGPQPPNSRSRQRTNAAEGPQPRLYLSGTDPEQQKLFFFGTRNWNAPECSVPERSRQPGEETDRHPERRRTGGSQQNNSPAANRRVAAERRRTGKEAGSDDTRHTSPRRSPQRAYSDPENGLGTADKIKFSTDTPIILQTINGRILKNVNYFSYFCINWKIMNLNAEVL